MSVIRKISEHNFWLLVWLTCCILLIGCSKKYLRPVDPFSICMAPVEENKSNCYFLKNDAFTRCQEQLSKLAENPPTNDKVNIAIAIGMLFDILDSIFVDKGNVGCGHVYDVCDADYNSGWKNCGGTIE